MPPHKPVVAAIFNTSPDLVDVVRRAFEPAGIVVVSVLTYQIREAAIDLENFLKQHNPNVIVYDIAPPYDANWQLFLHIRSLDAMQGRRIVLTAMNKKHVEALAGRDETIYEIVGKPYDLNRIVRAVKEAARQRSARSDNFTKWKSSIDLCVLWPCCAPPRGARGTANRPSTR